MPKSFCLQLFQHQVYVPLWRPACPMLPRRTSAPGLDSGEGDHWNWRTGGRISNIYITQVHLIDTLLFSGSRETPQADECENLPPPHWHLPQRLKVEGKWNNALLLVISGA